MARTASGLLVSGLVAGLTVVPALPAGATARALPDRAAARGRAPVGGPQMAGRGVIVNYPATQAKPLPKVKASAYVLADAGTGQVLAAKDPHGWYLPASTLKVLTAITLMPVLDRTPPWSPPAGPPISRPAKSGPSPGTVTGYSARSKPLR